MSRYLIWTVGDQWISLDTGQRHNRVWHWHMHLSRSLCGCWMAAQNSAALRGFLLVAPSRRAWLYWAGRTLGLFSISALTRCPVSHSTEAFTIHRFVCNMVESHWACSHPRTMAQQWLRDLNSSGFWITSQLPFLWLISPVPYRANTPLGQYAHRFRLTRIHQHC